MAATRHQPRVFFAWEERRGVRSLFGRGRTQQVLLIVATLVVFLVIQGRERHAGDVRLTRAAITSAMNAIAAWRADHDRACPSTLADLVSGGYLHQIPTDAWGRPLRLTCPGRTDPRGFDVTSDGPDGLPGGLDRVQ